MTKGRRLRHDYSELQKVSFYSDKDAHVRLKIRLQQDNLTQSDFFRCMIDNYLNKNEAVLVCVDNYKENNKRQNKERRAKAKRSVEKGNELKTKFALGEDEIESIFDILEQEHPEL